MTAGVGNNSAHICDGCVELCSEILEEELEGQDEEGSPALADIRSLKPKEIKTFLGEYVTGQDDAKKVLSVAVYNYYKRVTTCQDVNVDVQKSNILMLGPTGSGETYLARALTKILNVSSVITGATTLAEVGYVGEDAENILLKLAQTADYDIPHAECGIIYTDEIDKTTKRSENVSAIRNVSGEGVQQALLKILEGTVASVPLQGGRKYPYQELLQTDITNILFICGDALDGLEEIVEQCLGAGSIGFNVEVTNKDDLNIDELFKKVEPKDLTKFGLIPEFMGRVPMMVSLEQLTKEAMVHILPEPKNAPMRQYQRLLELDSAELEFTRGALEETAQLAVDHKIGTRGLRSILESVMVDLMYKIPSDDSIGICAIIRDVVRKVRQPELIYHDMPPVSAQKPLSERLGGDSKTGKIAQAVMPL